MEMQSRSKKKGIVPTPFLVVVPTFNERERVQRCLSSIAESKVPDGFELHEIFVLDGASTDDTVSCVQRWASENPNLELTIRISSHREGKAADLGNFHTELSKGAGDEIVVICDADVAIRLDSLGALLQPFQNDAELAITFGVDHPDDCHLGRWASSFQMLAVTALAKTLGEKTPRAYGRFFAYRVNALMDFTWSPKDSLDDLQLLSFIEATSLPCKSVWSAQVDVTPAGSFRDFYLQTTKFHVATAHVNVEKIGYRTWLAPARIAFEHPHWALAYIVARCAATWQHKFNSVEFGHRWVPPTSTKTSIP
jgi:glycosyltransferase involved in cell wall biosynthesis